MNTNETLTNILKNLELAKKKVSNLVDEKHEIAMKLQSITDLVLKYGNDLPKEFIKEFIDIVK